MRSMQGRGLVVLALAMGVLLGGCAQDHGPEETLRVRPSQALIDARAELLRALDHPNPFVRAYAVQSAAELLGDEAGGALMQALNDPMFNVRTVAAMAIGNIRYAPAKEKLQQMAKPVEGVGEPDLRVLSAVIYALTRLGDETYTHDLARYLRHREPEIRAAAAWAMGSLGHPSAIIPLKNMVKDEQSDKARQAMIEALAVLGEERYQRFLEASKYSEMENRVSAVRAMGRVGTPDMRLVLADLAWSDQPPQVRVVAMGELAELGAGGPEATGYMRECLRSPRTVLEEAMDGRREVEDGEVYDLQQMAAEALGKTDTDVAVNDLHPLLKSSDPDVRVATSTSILKLLSAYRDEGTGLEEPTPPSQSDENSGLEDEPDQPLPPKLHRAGGKD